MPVTRREFNLKNAITSTSLNRKKSNTVKTDLKPAVEKPLTKKLPTDLPIRAFETAADFENFLEDNHLTSPGIHLKLARKASGIPSITHEQLIEVALCFGWIDSQGHGFDENYHLTRCTPRRSKSLWSQKNVNTVGRLLAEGRMRPAGTAAVDAAKADGRWERAYAGPKTINVQKDLQDALDVNEPAHAFFKSLNSTERYAVLWRIDTASPAARAAKISALVDGLAVGNVPGRKKEKTEASEVDKSRIEKPPTNKKATNRTKR